jgi:hypothetical protein
VSHEYGNKYNSTLELPNLRAFYYDRRPPPARKLTRQRHTAHRNTRHGQSDTDDLEESVQVHLQRLCCAFSDWCRYPNVKSYCITGWKMAVGLLGMETEVIHFVDEMKERRYQWSLYVLGVTILVIKLRPLFIA